MKLTCTHGYFKFEEMQSGQLSHFLSLYDFEIVRAGDHFTFEALKDAPDYSIEGGTFLGAPTLFTFEGMPWDVMRVNRLVYDLSLGIVVPIDTITKSIQLASAGYYTVTTGMIQPGSVMEDGSRITDYAAFYIRDRLNFKYSEIDYE